MTASYSPMVHWKFWTQTGTPAPAAGYLLWFYQAGTTNLQAAYTDTTGLTQAANPIILDTNGECNFCLSDSLAYKIVLTDAANGNGTPGNVQSGWPLDNVQSGTLAASTYILALLASITSALQGAGAIGYNASLGYGANTLGAALQLTVSSANLVNQSNTTFTTAWGTGGSTSNPLYILTPTVPLTTYATGAPRYRVQFHATGTYGLNSLNVSGLGAISLVQYDQAGNLIPAMIYANMRADVEYLQNTGQFLVINPYPGTGNVIQGGFKNLVLSANGANSIVNITADEIILKNVYGDALIVPNVSLACNLSDIGFPTGNGLDQGAKVPNQWYAVYVIYNPATGVTASLASTIYGYGSTPLLPTGFTHFARVGWVKMDPSGVNLLSFFQYGRTQQYYVTPSGTVQALPLLGSGTATRWTALTVTGNTASGFLPPTAGKIRLLLIQNTAAADLEVAPNANYLIASSTTNPAIGFTSGSSGSMPVELVLEGSQIQWYSGATTNYLRCIGYEDNL